MSVASFANEPVLELRRAPVRAALGDALAELDRQLPLSVPVLAGDEQREGDELTSTDPGVPDRVVGRAAAASLELEVGEAVAVAAHGFRSWSALPASARAEPLLRAAAWMRERRLQLAALEVRECAKPWPEADADVCEAIDFLEYYARGAVALERGAELVQAPGERNEMSYAARGVTAVISPWNFPLAIPCGMSAAALATGNSVVLKPAEQSPACALMLVRALRESGVPANVINLLPGEGDVGEALVRHAGVSTIAFTGSKAVGLGIVRIAAEVVPGQLHIKRVIAELGGKNCVIVDADADLDEAVPAIVYSAFGYAGQKCSAASRVLVHEAIADRLLERLAGAVQVLVVGQAEQLGTDVPSLIERSAQERVSGYASRAVREGTAVVRVEPVPEEGWFVAPTVVADLPTSSPMLGEEVFGPLLSVERVATIEDALAIVEALPFALTGGLFARDPATVREVLARVPVGNMYVNRGTTGAKVGRQPFGGNRLSGNGTKAGGPDYLRSFVEPRAVSENTMRHGLVA